MQSLNMSANEMNSSLIEQQRGLLINHREGTFFMLVQELQKILRKQFQTMELLQIKIIILKPYQVQKVSSDSSIEVLCFQQILPILYCFHYLNKGIGEIDNPTNLHKFYLMAEETSPVTIMKIQKKPRDSANLKHA